MRRHFFDFEGQRIPIRREEATELYEVDAEGNLLSRKPLVMLLGDGSWVEEGREFRLNRRGEKALYQVVQVEYEVELHQPRGLYGQVRRRALVCRVPDWHEVEASVKAELEVKDDERP
ncbi:hypothetical protein [Thermus hydrothermalis]|uniref:hypothetical protein n=1 Tax=Thermus hydrothermalis TaxID=2908148 RepID=UPI001FAA3B82|nr:hypothetical protein [Thermus hydrothermalis]